MSCSRWEKPFDELDFSLPTKMKQIATVCLKLINVEQTGNHILECQFVDCVPIHGKSDFRLAAYH